MKSHSKEKVNDALSELMKQFESGQIADTVALATFPPMDCPSARWSLLNRALMVCAYTADARGYRQWMEVGRHVKKGAKAFHILGPRMVIAESDHGELESRLAGFVSIPVFRLEDTEGAPLNHQSIELPQLPLMDVAAHWGISVAAVPENGRFLGRYCPFGANETIQLATPEEKVFFHELAHAAHARVLRERGDRMKGGQDWKQEIVAELSAAVLCRLAGRSGKDTSGNSYRYISGYASSAGRDVLKGIAAVLADVERVLQRIMESAESSATIAA